MAYSSTAIGWTNPRGDRHPSRRATGASAKFQSSGTNPGVISTHCPRSGHTESAGNVCALRGGDVRQPTGLFNPPEGVRLLSLDARAHGRTRPMCDPSTLRFDTLGDDFVAFLDYLEITRAVVGGISMGAAIALNVAVR